MPVDDLLVVQPEVTGLGFRALRPVEARAVNSVHREGPKAVTLQVGRQPPDCPRRARGPAEHEAARGHIHPVPGEIRAMRAKNLRDNKISKSRDIFQIGYFPSYAPLSVFGLDGIGSHAMEGFQPHRPMRQFRRYLRQENGLVVGDNHPQRVRALGASKMAQCRGVED